MAHVNIGTLLDQYNISSVDNFWARDYRDRNAFLKHIRSAIEYKSKKELKELHDHLDVVEHEPGLKMCFQVYRDSSGDWINIPNENFAKKIAFLTSRTVIIFPFNEVSPRRGGDVEALLSLLCRTRPYLKKNYITIIPHLPRSDSLNQTLSRLMPANFQLPRLKAQFEEKEHPTFVKNLYHPLMSNITDQDIIKIRIKQHHLHRKLEYRLEHDLMAEPFDEKILLKELQDIHSYIMELDQLLNDVNNAIIKGSIYRLMFLAMSACAGIIVGPALSGIVSKLVAVSGTYQLKDIIQAIFDQKQKLIKSRNDDFFLTWKVNHPGELISLRGLLKHVLKRSKEHDMS